LSKLDCLLLSKIQSCSRITYNMVST